MKYEKYLVNKVGNQFPRKNLYILDLIEAQGAERERLEKERDKHPYIIELNNFKEKEKIFKDKLSKEASNIKLDSDSNTIKKLEKRLYKAKARVAFYKEYEELTYDAKLRYKTSLVEIRYLEEIIAYEKYLIAQLTEAEKDLKNIDENERNNILKEIEIKKANSKKHIQDENKRLKSKLKEGVISKKAYKQEKQILKLSQKDLMEQYKLEDPKLATELKIKNLKYQLNNHSKTKLEILESDISDLRGRIPMETEDVSNRKHLFGIPIPGLGQLLNGQKEKALLFFIGSLFIYFIAIPYALGFGNYQGSGIHGLITLAEGGRKLDKSLIFMIEGIIAIVLLIFSIGIYYFSYKDSKTVEINKSKGIRPKNWFETKQTLRNDGFPYLTISPAIILVVFIVIIPIVTTVLISFTNLDPSHQNKFTWIGLSNYKLIALGEGVAGQTFWLILGWTLIWTLGATSLAIFIGFVLSLLVNQERIKGKLIFRTIYLLPWAVPAFITIMFFSIMVSRGGPITTLLNNAFNISLDIKNNTYLTRTALILIQAWLGSSYIFLLSTGVLQGISKDLYEAAEIDGATGFQQTLRITIPLVLYQISPLLISQYTFNFNNFSIIYLFNEGGPFNPSKYGNLAGSSDILISYIYKLTIENQYQAIGAAITVIISLVLMFFTFLGFRRTKAFKGD